ncbi:regulatory protein GemA [Pseudoalteromonas sp. Ps84H-4]|uniref:regulatory protein GemA n=1 Tax=Pseudoalteromonas sp. Ps84H-4 TaxID=2954502 RepID=UPI002096AC1C|nr:regulatory protein GemA [Pseudoalteromonas sp. Ps84H-4]MCO7251262.1 regulatory protein GemA [Pseudoalteromonas sp. Ps84H-4]
MKKLIQLIQIAKRDLNMEDDVYRANLKAWAGCDSTTQMDKKQLDKVIKGMEKLGFKKKKPVRRKVDQALLDKEPLLKKLGQVWTVMKAHKLIENGSYIALEKWAAKQSKGLNDGKEIERLDWMVPIANQLIERLKRYHLRLMKQAMMVKIPAVLRYYKELKTDELDEPSEMFAIQTKLQASRLNMPIHMQRVRYLELLQAYEDCNEFIRRFGKSSDDIKGVSNAKAR